MMYHAACRVEFQPFKRSYSQLTFFNFLQNMSEQANFPEVGGWSWALKILDKYCLLVLVFKT